MALVAKQFGAKEIFICNTSNIDSMRHGRPQTVIIEQDQNLHNGAIVKLLDTQESAKGEQFDHVHGIEEGEAVTGAGAAIGKFIVVDPEINVEQYRRIDNSLAAFTTLERNATHTAYELAKYDRIEYSEAYFKACQEATDEQKMKEFHEALIANKTCNINEQGQLVIEPNGALRIVSVRPQRVPLMFNEKHELMPESYLMIKLEVVPQP